MRRRRGAAYDPVSKPQLAGDANIEPNPLDSFVVNPFAVGDIETTVMWGFIVV